MNWTYLFARTAARSATGSNAGGAALVVFAAFGLAALAYPFALLYRAVVALFGGDGAAPVPMSAVFITALLVALAAVGGWLAVVLVRERWSRR